MLKMVAFDIDGTLAETFPVIFEAFRKTVFDYTGKTVSDQTILATFGVNEVGMLRELAPGAPASIMDDFYQNYRDAHRVLSGPFSGVQEVLQTLREAGVRTAVVTGKGAESCEITLSALNLTSAFAPVLTGDPDHPNKAAQFQKLLTDEGLQPDELVYVGDTAGDLKNCREVGIHCYSAAWADSVKLEELKSAGADIYLMVSDLQRQLSKVLGH